MNDRVTSGAHLKNLGAFELHERIGAGGMGVVYRAVDRRTGSTVAVKVIHDHLQDDGYIARFRSEAHLASLLTSPYIVRVLEFGAEKGQYFLATEFLEGSTIATLMSRGRLSVEQSLTIATGVAMALQAAASQGIVHRDIKPDNILQTSDSSIKLMDFGVARLSYVETQAHFLGTVSYAAPEQFKGISTTQSDIYSLGVVLFQMLAGELPFKAATLSSLMRMHEETPPPLERVTAPQEIRDVVARCLAKDPTRRYANPSELLGALQNARRLLSRPAAVLTPQATETFCIDARFEQPDTQLGETQARRGPSRTGTPLPAETVEKIIPVPATTLAPREKVRFGSTRLAAVGAFAVGATVIAGMFFAFQAKSTPPAVASTLDDAFQAALKEFDVEECPPAGHVFKETCITSAENAQSNVDPATGIAALGMGNNLSGSMLFMGRDAANQWHPWFETQNQPYDLIRLPGDLRVCSLDGPVTLRSKASEESRGVSTFKSGDILRADSFVLTRPLPRHTGNDFKTKGEGWYKVSSPAVGWVSSLKVSDAGLGDCEIHDRLEREFTPASLRAATATPIATATTAVPTSTAVPLTPVPPTPTPPPPPPAPVGIRIGSTVAVSNTGNCLRLRESAAINGRQVICLLDGATAKVIEGPLDSDGVHWWRLQGRAGGRDFTGWAAEYDQTGVVWLVER